MFVNAGSCVLLLAASTIVGATDEAYDRFAYGVYFTNDSCLDTPVSVFAFVAGELSLIHI